MQPPDSRGVRIINLVPAIFVGFGLYLAWRATSLVAQPLLLIVLALVIASALNPAVLWLHARFRVPRALSSFTILFLVVGGLGLLGWLLIPTFVTQLSSLITSLPGEVASLQRMLADASANSPLLASASAGLNNVNLASQLQSVLPGTVTGLLGFTTTLLSSLLLFVILLLLGFYVLLQPEPLLRGIMSGIPHRYRDDVSRALIRIGSQLGGWLTGQVILSAAMGVLVYLALQIVGFFGIDPHDVFLYSVIAGVTAVIPVVGGLIGLIPPVLATISPHPIDALWVAVAVFSAEQVVYQVLTPIVFGRGSSLHPASLLAGVLLFSGLFGWVGAFLAVPFLIIVKAIYEELYLPSVLGAAVTTEEVADLVRGQAPPDVP
ncbi:MAG TPA: AI-2E family transporter [Deinococcales bacterium]|nr:AI-2E family transporter [Deinococcales bacterium]